MEVVYLMGLCKFCLLKFEAIKNSRPLTTDVLNVTSLAPLSPVNLTMKSKVVMPPPGYFTSPDRYCRKHWRRVQHLPDEFWNLWRKEVLLTLQKRGKWDKQQRNWKIGHVLLLKADAECNLWPIAKIVALNSDAIGDAHCIKILVGAADKSDSSIHYLEKPVKK